MRAILALTTLTVLGAPLLASDQFNGTCASEFRAAFPVGGNLRLQIRSGDTDVIGTDSPQIRIWCELKEPDQAKDVHIAFRRDANRGELVVKGGPTNNFRVRVEVPRHSHLWVRSPAGDLKVSGVVGDKDIELYAGDLVITVGDPGDYRRVDGSVHAGDLNAPAFGVSKGGLFRSFQKENAGGRYHLHAHVGAGDVVLK
jgi:hypothetical protein